MAGTTVLQSDPNTRLFLPPCRVCGDKAAGFHYGVNTCEACKGFFHRSLRRFKEYKCRASRTTGYCEYKPGKRKSCQYCRYQRCLNAGMSKDAIKTGRYTYLKRTEDTHEIKRLQDLEHQIPSDEQDMESVLVSSSLSRWKSRKHHTEERTRNGYHADTFMEVDVTTTHTFVTPSVTESDVSCSSSDLSSSETNSVRTSSISKSRKRHNYGTSKQNGCQNNNAQSTNGFISSEGHSASQSELSPDSYKICTKQSWVSGKFSFSASSDSNSDQSENVSMLCTPESGVTSQLDIDDPGLASYTLLEAIDNIQSDGNSVIRRLLSNVETGKCKDSPQKSKSADLKYNYTEEHINFSIVSSAVTDKSPLSLDSSPCGSHQMSVNDSSMPVLLNIKRTSGSGCKDLIGEPFDLFPDISFCLEGHPISSPAYSMSHVAGPSSAMTLSGLLSPEASQSPESNNISPSPSPGVIMLNLDSGQRLKVSDDYNTETDLCHTPESNCPIRDEIMVHNEDNITLQIMEEYTQGLDVIIDSPAQTQALTSVQTLLTSQSPDELSSVSPLSSCSSGWDGMSVISPTTNLTKRVKNMELSDIPDLYSDMDAVIALLKGSHKENIGDFKYLSKEEMTAQQEAHYESCQLKKQTFGDLGFLPEQEYDDIYSMTGIDVDNRRTIIQKYLSRMERCVRGLVLFAKTIPGFAVLDINTQVELIKLARSEIAIFTVYPTVNLSLGVILGLTGESWTCHYDMGKDGFHLAIAEYMIFCDKLQKMFLTQEEEVLLKAILVVSTDRDSSVRSPLAEAIRWQLILCLKYSLEKHRDQPSLLLARCMLALTQSRTVAEKFKEFLRELKMQKYSSIEQNPLMWELFSGILEEEEGGEQNWDKLCQHIGDGKAGMWSPCLLG